MNFRNKRWRWRYPLAVQALTISMIQHKRTLQNLIEKSLGFGFYWKISSEGRRNNAGKVCTFRENKADVGAADIVFSLQYTLNGTVPKRLGVPLIPPSWKGRSPYKSVQQFRYISVLPSVSEIEKMILWQMILWLDEWNIWPRGQSGFRNGLSTCTDCSKTFIQWPDWYQRLGKR